MRTYEIGEDEKGQAFIFCRRCDLRSFHPKDIENLYCGKCGQHCPKNIEKLSEEHAKFYTDMGYGMPIKVDGEIVALGPFLFTVGIIVGMDETGYRCRYCYDTEHEAMIGLLSWIGSADEEPSGYIVKK